MSSDSCVIGRWQKIRFMKDLRTYQIRSFLSEEIDVLKSVEKMNVQSYTHYLELQYTIRQYLCFASYCLGKSFFNNGILLFAAKH